jgi:adenine-specific DNA-methyltransferase
MKREVSFNLECADCLSWLEKQHKGSFWLFVLDPPYNVGYKYSQFRDEKPPAIYLHEQLLMLAHCAELLQEGGSIFYLNYPEFAAEIWGRVDFLDKYELMPWVYHAHVRGTPLRKASRTWLWLSKGDPLVNQEAFMGEYRNPEDRRIQERLGRGLKPTAYDWFDMEPVKNTSHEKRVHPCQVPERMVERFILGASNPGDLVGDCYCGSGTTAICALRHGRQFAGCELDPAYVQVANEAVRAEFGLDQPLMPCPEVCRVGRGSTSGLRSAG